MKILRLIIIFDSNSMYAVDLRVFLTVILDISGVHEIVFVSVEHFNSLLFLLCDRIITTQ